MSEASRRSRVTITLGRSGQVVKRAGLELDGDGISYEQTRAGTKRPVRERLGSQLDSSSLHGSEISSKRSRGEASINAYDPQIGKNDLRFKLMQKSAQKRAQTDEGSTIDLRSKLSKLSKPEQPPRNIEPQPRMAEPRDVSVRGPLPPSRTSHSFSQMDSTSNSYSPWTLNHIRRQSPDRFLGPSRGLSPPRNSGSFISSSRDLSPRNERGRFMGTSSRPLLPIRNSGSYMGSSRGLSPIRNTRSYMGSSRASSPPRNIEDFRGRPLSRGVDDPRASSSSHTVRGALNAQPPVTNVPYTSRTTIPPLSTKPPLPAFSTQIPPPGSSVHKSPFIVEEHQTVDSLLNSLGLGKYAVLFKAEEVDMHALRQMGENDLKDLLIPMGPRKKILQALAPRSKRLP